MKLHRLFFPALVASVLQLQSAELGDLSGREAQMAAAALSKQNDILRAEIVRLREDVVKLTVELARSRSQLDEGRVRQGVEGQSAERRVADEQQSVTTKAGASWLITDVNPDLKLVVFEAGKEGDVKQGMILHAMRSEKLVARLRVVDVRERMTGAVIEEKIGSGNPEKGDRVVLMLAPK